MASPKLALKSQVDALAAAGTTDVELSAAVAAAVATLTGAIAAKQDMSGAATDAEVASVNAALTSAIAGVQAAVDAAASTGATDMEVANAVAALAATVATDAELAAAVAPDRARLATLEAFRMPAPTSAAVDTPALNALLETARVAGGGVIDLYPGAIYNTNAPIVIGTGVRLRMNGATLKLVAGANCNILESYNFAGLTNTDTWTNVPNSFQVMGGFFDGNKANQGAGNWRGIAIYGYGYKFDNFVIRNCKGVGFWTEGASAGLGPVADQLESFIHHFKIHNCEGVLGAQVQIGTTNASGMMFAGPHDSKIKDGVLYYCGTGAGVTGGGTVLDIPLTDNPNGTELDGVHIWGNDFAGAGGGYDYGIRVGGSGLTLGKGVEVETAAVAGVRFTVGGNRCDCRVFHVGTTFRAAGKGVVLDNGVSAISGSMRIENCGGGALDIGSGAGGRNLKVAAVYTAIAAPATPLIGTPAATDQIDMLVTDSSGGGTALNAVSQLTLPFTIRGAARRQPFPSRAEESWKATGMLYENMSRLRVDTAEATPTLGTLFLFAGPYLYAGDTITNIVLQTGSAGAGTPTHQWFVLTDISRNVLGKTVDDLTTAWASFTTKSLALSAPYVVTADIQTYVGIVVTGATAPNFRGKSQTSGLAALAPILMGNSTTGLTVPGDLGATAGAITQSGGCVPYVRLS